MSTGIGNALSPRIVAFSKEGTPVIIVDPTLWFVTNDPSQAKLEEQLKKRIYDIPFLVDRV